MESNVPDEDDEPDELDDPDEPDELDEPDEPDEPDDPDPQLYIAFIKSLSDSLKTVLLPNKLSALPF